MSDHAVVKRCPRAGPRHRSTPGPSLHAVGVWSDVEGQPSGTRDFIAMHPARWCNMREMLM